MIKDEIDTLLVELVHTGFEFEWIVCS